MRLPWAGRGIGRGAAVICFALAGSHGHKHILQSCGREGRSALGEALEKELFRGEKSRLGKLRIINEVWKIVKFLLKKVAEKFGGKEKSA